MRWNMFQNLSIKKNGNLAQSNKPRWCIRLIEFMNESNTRGTIGDSHAAYVFALKLIWHVLKSWSMTTDGDHTHPISRIGNPLKIVWPSIKSHKAKFWRLILWTNKLNCLVIMIDGCLTNRWCLNINILQVFYVKSHSVDAHCLRVTPRWCKTKNRQISMEACQCNLRSVMTNQSKKTRRFGNHPDA
jgi:hypothetical protein